MLRTTVLLRQNKTRSETVEEGREITQGAEGAGEGEAGLLVKTTASWVLI